MADSLRTALARFNGRHPWSHTDHFHGWVLRHLPASRGTALDVGCGQGALALALSDRFRSVVALDADAQMAAQCAARLSGCGNVEVRQGSFPTAEGSYDLITMVAVLHHLEVTEALRAARELLAPGGRLLVVGLARSRSAADVAWDLVSAVLNPVVGVLKHPRAASAASPPPFPVVEPTMTFAQTRQAVTAALPGARVRRRLFFRYTAVWQKPAVRT